jgi:hypothetical protein
MMIEAERFSGERKKILNHADAVPAADIDKEDHIIRPHFVNRSADLISILQETEFIAYIFKKYGCRDLRIIFPEIQMHAKGRADTVPVRIDVTGYGYTSDTVQIITYIS